MQSFFRQTTFSIFLLLAFSFALLHSCETDDTSPAETSQFLSLHVPGDDIDPDSYLGIMTISGGEPVFEKLADVYPRRHYRWDRYVSVSEDLVALSLHAELCPESYSGTGVRRRGVWIDVNTGQLDTLPVLPAGTAFGFDSNQYRWSFINDQQIRVSESGHVLYWSCSHELHYSDQYRERMVRYHPATGEKEAAYKPHDFVVSQPEVTNPNLEAGKLRATFLSRDGRFAYGAVQAEGVDFGQVIWGSTFLFKYDFETHEYTRLCEEGDGFSHLYGMTDDSKHLYVNFDGTRKLFNIETGATTTLDLPSADKTNRVFWSDEGYLSDPTLNILRYYDFFQSELVEISIPNWARSPQFSHDNSYAYFGLRDTDLLLRTNNLTEEAQVDTVTTLPDDVSRSTLGVLVLD